MMADLMDQHVPHHRGEILAGLAPIIEQRPAKEEDHVDIVVRRQHALLRKGNTTVEPEKIEGGFEIHLFFGLLVGKFLDPDDHGTHMPPQFLWYSGECLLRQALDVGSGRRKLAHDAKGGGKWSSGWSVQSARKRSRNSEAGPRSRTATRSGKPIISVPSAKPGPSCRASRCSPRRWIITLNGSMSIIGWRSCLRRMTSRGSPSAI